MRALDRQISTLFYERLLGSQDKDKLAHQDVGQMDMYVRVFDEQMRGEGDNPTLGLILCSERNAAVAKYSLLADKSQLFASKCQRLKRFHPDRQFFVIPAKAGIQGLITKAMALAK